MKYLIVALAAAVLIVQITAAVKTITLVGIAVLGLYLIGRKW
jgi:hypothetical protein